MEILKKLKRKFDSLEEKYKDFQEGKDYTLSIDKKGNKVYDIHSEELRKEVFGNYESHYDKWLKDREIKKKRLEKSSFCSKKKVNYSENDIGEDCEKSTAFNQEMQKNIKESPRLENKQEYYPFG